ncbi:uncharacterized protein LOC111071747 isoform X2 [Drosophila obscura]|nr:uncharacterized protein LOC111071747 isoform X2 [Drosophila obscura]
MVLPGNEAACKKPSKAVASTTLKGELWTFAVWYPVPIHMGICKHSKYPDPNKRRPKSDRYSIIIATDDKNYVMEYTCIDTGIQPRIETVVYTKKQKLRPAVIKEIESAHTEVGLDKAKIWYCIYQKI